MKICVLSGSPKGKYSITYQTVRFLEKKCPKDSFETVHVGQRIRALERDMTPALEAIGRADLLLFCYPVYTFTVPSQLHRFIELLKESGADVSGKYAAQMSTSKHFYDVTAHAFIQENCLDLGLCYVGGLSADMEDLLTKKGQHEAVAFWKLVHWRVKNQVWETIQKNRQDISKLHERERLLDAEDLKKDCQAKKADTEKLVEETKQSGVSDEKSDDKDSVSKRDVRKSKKREIVIVANLLPNDAELSAMIEDFRAQYPHASRVVNLQEYPFAGGCLGCFRCATNGKCVYKDGFDDFLRNEIQTASAIVYAFRITDHSMGSRMKMYDDRQFCNGHRTVTAGMPMGYLICGNLEREPNLRMVIEARAEVGGNFLAGTATDAAGVSALAKTLDYAIATHLTQPANFYGVGGMKIFRDLIWLMRGMMKADHAFYKEHGLYDFPQKERGTALKMQLVGALLSNPKIVEKMGNKMNEGMLAPYQKVLDRLEEKTSQR